VCTAASRWGDDSNAGVAHGGDKAQRNDLGAAVKIDTEKLGVLQGWFPDIWRALVVQPGGIDTVTRS
jgi:hypothetical protein